MFNPALDLLTDYPFDRLRALLDGIDPPAGGKPVIMSLGEPQHTPPPLIAKVIAEQAGEWGRYPPIGGTVAFLDAVTAWLTRRYHLPGAMIEGGRHVLAVSGTREALYMAGDLCIPGEKAGTRPCVLIPNPFYQVYQGAAVMSGADALYLPATRESGFLPDLTRVAAPDLDRAALCFLCSPANPQGAVADMDYLKEAITLARAHDFVLALDECYGEIYDRAPPPGGLEACAELGGGLENVLVFHSLSKRSSAPGLRSGFVAGDADLIGRLRMLRNYAGATLPIPLLAASAALWLDEAHVEANRALYRAKFDLADEMIKGRFGQYRPGGGFYLWLEVGDGERAARELWRGAGVKVIPGAYLARPGPDGDNPGEAYIRVALVHAPEVVSQALERMLSVL
jgi:aspartate/methionine/tyrosine aminotransferase